jgi:hypothetical protein
MEDGKAGLQRDCRRKKGEKIGWGGRIRTFTVLINSEVSYQLDHAPAGVCSGCFGEGRSVQARTAK